MQRQSLTISGKVQAIGKNATTIICNGGRLKVNANHNKLYEKFAPAIKIGKNIIVSGVVEEFDQNEIILEPDSFRDSLSHMTIRGNVCTEKIVLGKKINKFNIACDNEFYEVRLTGELKDVVAEVGDEFVVTGPLEILPNTGKDGKEYWNKRIYAKEIFIPLNVSFETFDGDDGSEPEATGLDAIAAAM